jgi:hypothetical protein
VDLISWKERRPDCSAASWLREVAEGAEEREEPDAEVREPLTREIVGSLTFEAKGIEVPPELAGKTMCWWSAN